MKKFFAGRSTLVLAGHWSERRPISKYVENAACPFYSSTSRLFSSLPLNRVQVEQVDKEEQEGIINKAVIIEGQAIARDIFSSIKKSSHSLVRQPGLAAVLVGDRPDSRKYVSLKQEAATKLGFYSEVKGVYVCCNYVEEGVRNFHSL
jgi:hypothetical protein